MKPIPSMTPDELMAEARAKLAELQRAADDLVAMVQKRIESGDVLSRLETRGFNRAASMARYVAHCARAAQFKNPGPSKRRRAGNFWFVTPFLTAEPLQDDESSDEKGSR